MTATREPSKATLGERAAETRREASFVPLERQEREEKTVSSGKSFCRRKKNSTSVKLLFTTPFRRNSRRGTAPSSSFRVLFRLPRRLLFDIARVLSARVDGKQSRRRPHRGEKEQAIKQLADLESCSLSLFRERARARSHPATPAVLNARRMRIADGLVEPRSDER